MNMKRILTYLVPLATALVVVAGVSLEGACNNVGDCPTAAITPGAACSGDNLQCPYTLDSPSPACDGTNVEGGIATSCVCTSGTWVCPDPISCDTGDGGGDETTDDGGGEGSVDDGGGDGAGDAAIDATDDTSTDAANDTGADVASD
jgi:hypothetical protein